MRPQKFTIVSEKPFDDQNMNFVKILQEHPSKFQSHSYDRVGYLLTLARFNRTKIMFEMKTKERHVSTYFF